MTLLRNKYSKEDLLKQRAQENFKRVTISFYKYVYLNHINELRDELYTSWSKLGVLGRIYISKEGINAQFNVPEHNLNKFKAHLFSYPEFKDIPFKIAIEEKGKSFLKLNIKVKEFIVADGLPLHTYDVTNVEKHLNAKEFNQALEEENSICIDMRNHYESEIGHFKGAITPDCDTFREELEILDGELKGKENNKVLLYCTGGVRCEKTSAYLKHKGFKDVNQLHRGIINYKKETIEQELENKYIGKNFVFDERRAEKISNDIIANCHQCNVPCDTHNNCANDACHLLFIQCSNCKEKLQNCCTPKCKEIFLLPLEEQRKIRKEVNKNKDCLQVYKSRLRPKLPELIKEQITKK